MEKNYGLDQKISGKPLMQYMADTLELNDKQEIEIERAKITIGILKQMNNTSRLMLDVAKVELKKKQAETDAKIAANLETSKK